MSDRVGFDPGRLSDRRPGHVVQALLSEETQEQAQGFTEIKVVGVGGAGTNTVNRMVEAGVQGIDFVAVNCDVQALATSHARRTVAIGQKLTRGLGTGGNPRLGMQSAEMDRELLADSIRGADMVFVTAGLGGGTGTGAAPFVAGLARAENALTVGVVTLPFPFEGRRRSQIAKDGIAALREAVDTLIVISNERLLREAPRGQNLLEAFVRADGILREGITGIANLILVPGLINLDFADVNSVMSNSGSASMGFGTGSGEERAEMAARSAMDSPLLEGALTEARGLLLNITGGPDMSLLEVQRIVELIGSVASADANVVVGASVHPKLVDEIRVTMIAAGFT